MNESITWGDTVPSNFFKFWNVDDLSLKEFIKFRRFFVGVYLQGFSQNRLDMFVVMNKNGGNVKFDGVMVDFGFSGYVSVRDTFWKGTWFQALARPRTKSKVLL